MDFNQLAVGGTLLIPLVIGLVQVIKNLGVTGKALTYVALAIGALLGLFYKLYQMIPGAQPVIEVIVFVIGFALFALAATGIYDLGKTWVAAIQPVAKGGPGVVVGVASPPGLPKGVGVDAVSVDPSAPVDVDKQT